MLQIWRADMAALLPALALAGLAAVTAEHRLQCSSLPSFDNSDVGCYKLNIFAAVKYFCVVRSCTSTSGACARRGASSWAACSASRSSHTSSATRSGTRVWWDEIQYLQYLQYLQLCVSTGDGLPGLPGPVPAAGPGAALLEAVPLLQTWPQHRRGQRGQCQAGAGPSFNNEHLKHTKSSNQWIQRDTNHFYCP